MKKPEMNDELLLRYSRQIMLPGFDIDGQEALRNSHALIIGLGGLGCPVALYLAAAGTGKMTLVDFDCVDLSNLQRQIAHSQTTIGDNKAESVARIINNINSDVTTVVCPQKADQESLQALVRQADVVIDCTDSYQSRSNINVACVVAGVPLVSGSAIRWEGQLSVFDFRNSRTPCYHCLYGHISNDQLTCSEAGVMSPVVGIVGSMQALEAIKVLTNKGESLLGRLLVFDGAHAQWRELKLRRDPECTVCG